MIKKESIGISGSYKFKNWQLICLLAAGSALRFLYGFKTAIWNQAHDQIAWEIPLHELYEDGSLNYKQLINYPHEGGTILLSLFTFLFLPFVKSAHALSITAFLIDLGSRLVQIVITKKLFGDRAALYFGIWTVFAVPLMLPWGLAFFGLHNGSVWLFMFLYCMLSKPISQSQILLVGTYVGFAIWFSYHNLILIPGFFIGLFILKSPKKLRMGAIFVGTMCLTLLPHILLRIFADHGFPFEKNTLLSAGRPSLGDINVLTVFQNFKHTTLYHLPDSLFLFSIKNLAPTSWRAISLLLLALVLISCFKSQAEIKKAIALGLILILLYLFAFASSSMYSEHMADRTFYSYRHFAFICPLVFLCFIAALLQTGRFAQLNTLTLLILCVIVSSVHLYNDLKKNVVDYKVAAWILSRKYGNDVEKLLAFGKVIEPARRQELIYGYGWGLAVHHLYGKNPGITKTKELLKIYESFPDSCQKTLMEGVKFAFIAAVTPAIDPRFLKIMEAVKMEENVE